MGKAITDFKIAVEAVAKVWPEVAELHRAHIAETEGYLGDSDPGIDYQSYINMEQAGMFRLFVAREIPSNRVIGNIGFYMSTDNHSKLLQAWEDVFFVAKEFRQSGIGARLLTFAESHLKGSGVGYVKMSSRHHTNGPDLTKFLTSQGYAPVSVLFGKKL